MSVIGLLAIIASLAIIVLSLPFQIYKNYVRKSCEGITPSFIYSSSLIYALWSLYGWTKPDWYLVIAQTPGLILILIILFQLIYYKRKRRRSFAQKGFDSKKYK
jgi:uncharacterized protein with PQ loop repeat